MTTDLATLATDLRAETERFYHGSLVGWFEGMTVRKLSPSRVVLGVRYALAMYETAGVPETIAECVLPAVAARHGLQLADDVTVELVSR